MLPRCLRLVVPPRTLLGAAVLLSLAGCKRGEPVGRPDSAAPAAPAVVDSAVAKRGASGWDTTMGPVLLVQGATREDAIVLIPAGDEAVAIEQLDSATLRRRPVMLFGRGGTRYSAQLGTASGESTDDCERWPLRAVAPDGAWSMGFVGGHVVPLPLDSVSILSARDSATLVAEVSRLASSVTAPTAAAFQGLRFTVHDIRRFEAAPGVQALVAHVVRRVNQEANPQEEQTLLVAERDSGVTSGPYALAYAERAFGREEQVVTPEVLAAVRTVGRSRPVLVVARDNDDGVVYSLLERTGSRRWRSRWTSAITRCGVS